MASLFLAATALAVSATQALAAPEDFGVETAEASLSTHQAGAHPNLDLTFEVKTDPDSEPNVFGLKAPYAATRNVRFDLPPGLIGNPNVFGFPQQCPVAELAHGLGAECPNGSQVGVTHILAYELTDDFFEPVYMMVPPGGDIVARLGFIAGTFPTFIDLRLDPARDNALVAEITDATALAKLVRAETTTWGVPADPSHDTQRMTPDEAFNGATSSEPRPPGGRPLPFLINPTRCGVPLEVGVSASSWVHPDVFDTQTAALPPITGCDRVPFGADLTLAPTTTRADSSSGVDATLSIPQPDGADVLAPSHLKKAVVTLPEGMSINPSAADGLDACTTAQIGLTSTNPIRFDAATPACPDGSKVGTAVISTPALPDPVPGSLYLADQDDNPFDTLLSGYLVAQGQGVTIKIAGRFDTDPQSGRITATFDNNPQLPFESVALHFKGGNRGVLVTPPTCGIYEIHSELTPWSGTPPVNRTSTFTVDRAPDGGPCVAGDPSQPADPADRARLPFGPVLTARSVFHDAGRFSPFVLRLTRTDGEQEPTRLRADLPPGLLGKLAGVTYCSNAALASIPTAPGSGQAERANPSCPPASRLGYVRVGAGAGPTPFYVPGTVYLAGPYQGAPFSIAVVTPAVTGPFDLGNVVIRSKLTVDPDDAQVHVDSGPLPTILEGIPLHIRDIRVIMNRPNFTLNPTNCDPMRVTARVGGAGSELTDPADDSSAAVSDRFQVGGCAALGFRPRLFTKALGRRGFGRHPTFRTVLTMPQGQANIKRVTYKLPKSLTIDQRFTTGLCTETQLRLRDCAGARVYGRAVARTPLLGYAAQGPVYLVSGAGGLPRLAMILRGPPWQPIKLVVRGRTFGTRDGGYRTVISGVPDAPVSRFALTLFGSRQSIIQSTRNLCRSRLRGKVAMVAHNNMRMRGAVKLATPGCKKKGKKKRRRSRRRR